MTLFPSSTRKYLCFLSWCFFFIFPSQSSALDSDIIKVRNAIKEAVGASSSNIEVGIFGSHVDGKNFISPLKGGSSDFDMRLVFKNVAPDDADALRQWQAFREKLRQALEKQYPDAGELAKILDKTNVYPPEELMKGVAGRADAFNRFKQLNVSPKLSHESAEALTDETFKELAGGLYGETTEKATRQGFEKTVGKVIGKDSKGEVKEFLADLTHRAEGEGVYTVKGSGNAASQWIDDALAAIEKGNAKGIAKNVQRAKILNKGKDLARVPLKESDMALKNAADEMEAILTEFGEEALEGEKLAEFEKRVSEVVSKYGLQDVLKTCKIDAELLKRFGNPKFEGLIIDGLLKGVGKWGKLRGALGELWSKVPEGSVPAVLNVVILTFEAPEQYEKEGALKAALESALGLVTLSEAFGPIGWAQLASTITVSILDIVTEYFKDRIYEFAAGSQSCSDLIAGIYTVKGRETQLVNPLLEAKCHNVEKIEDLACYTSDEDVVLRLIECHAKNAAKRFEDGGAGEKETAKGILDALMKKCGRDGQNLGSVLRDWMGTRESYKNQLDDFTRNFDGASLKIGARPDPAEIDDKGPVSVRLEAEIANFSEKTGKAILQCLGGQDTLGFVYPKYKWGVNGILQKETTLPSVDLNFDKPGVYLIDLAVEVEYGSNSPDVKGGTLSKGGQFSLTVSKNEEKTSKDDKKEDKKDQTSPPPVMVQPDSYTKGQIGSGKETGVKTGIDTQTGTTGQTDTSKTDTSKTDIGKTDTTVTGKTDTGKIDTTTASKTDSLISTKPPACTYQYSEWGECRRATKTQTRTVIDKEPAGCEEKGKPVLEQGCLPPPTEEEKRNSYLNCLCRCYSGWAGNIGVWYDPEGKSKPECKSSGPCFGGAGAFGCTRRHSFGAPNDCAKACYEGAYGKGTYDEKKADKIRRDENKKFKEPLKLTVNEGKCPITAQLGDIINLTANVEGGIPPHTFTWSGDGQAKENTFTFANSRQPGPHSISVTVTDDEGGSITATCSVVVDAVTVQIEKTSPKENTLPVGSQASFKAIVKSGKNEVSGALKFQWQPHPEVRFGDDKSPLFETTSPNTTATYTKKGTFPMWVQVLKKMGEIYQTIGESPQIPMTIVSPELKLSFQPQNPKVGQEVKLTVTEKPKMDDKTISFWWEISGNTLNAGPLKNEREYTFRPKDIKPVAVTVHGKARDGGDDLGEDKATITAQSYEVKLSEPQHMGSKPKIWKCDTQLGGAQNCGLVEVTKELAVFNDIFIKSSVAPEPEKTPLRYAWSVIPEGICGLPGAGQELNINCSQTGSYTVTVKVRDSQDVELGTASTQVGITISKDELEKGKKHLVSLQADKTMLKTGETAAIKANVQGGKPPYTYKWSDGLEGKGESARFTPKKAGPQKITLEVTDSAKQKSTASLEIKVEASKLEVTLSADKTSLKSGETAKIRVNIKGGAQPYTFTWSNQVKGNGETVNFSSKEPGFFKIYVEVRDGDRKKGVGNIDLTVTESMGDGKSSITKAANSKTSDTKEPGAKTSGTKRSDAKTIEQKDTDIRDGSFVGKQMIEPEILKVAPGETGVVKAFEIDKAGKKTEIPSSKISWKIDPYRGATIDKTGKVRVDKSAKAGTKVKILTGLDKSQITGTIEIIPSPDRPTGKDKEAEKDKGKTPPLPPISESKFTKVIKDTSRSDQKATTQEPYNPLADSGFKSQKPPVDISKIDKFKEDFQQGQWATQDKKTKSSSDSSQQNVQQQPIDYTNTAKKPVDQGSASPTPTPTPTQPPTDTTKTTTDKNQTSTQTATTKGIDVKVVGNAPSGKCLIVDGQLVPVKGYKENIANMTVTLTGPVTKSVTSAASGAFKFPEIPAGNYVISVKQWNYGMTKQNFTAPSGKSVKIVLKGSCPFLYVWTGKDYEKENDIYSVARLMPQELLSEKARLLAARNGLFLNHVSMENIPEKLKKDRTQVDYYRISRSLKPTDDGNYRLKIVEQATEHSFTDRVRLMAVDHRKNQKVGIDREGHVFMFEGLESLSSFQKPAFLYDGESIEINLPPEAFQKGILSITWQGFQDGNPEGRPFALGQPKLTIQRRDPQGIWQTIDWAYPRDEVQESLFLLKDPGPGWDGDGKIKIVASSCDPEKYHRIDTLGWAPLVSDLPQVTYLNLLSAVKSTGEKVLNALSGSDGHYLFLGPEEAVSLVFRGLPVKENTERSFIFVSEGFYIPLPLIRLTSN